MAEDDYVEARHPGVKAIERIPLVTVPDEVPRHRLHSLLFDDQERSDLCGALHPGPLKRRSRDRGRDYIVAASVICAAVFSAAGLLLGLLNH
jgi:hypothetical protein